MAQILNCISVVKFCKSWRVAAGWSCSSPRLLCALAISLLSTNRKQLRLPSFNPIQRLLVPFTSVSRLYLKCPSTLHCVSCSQSSWPASSRREYRSSSRASPLTGCDVNARTDYGRSPLDIAAAAGRADVIQQLLLACATLGHDAAAWSRMT